MRHLRRLQEGGFLFYPELEEETGFLIAEKERIRRIGTRQLNGTLSTHVAHVFAVELSDEELEFLRRQQLDNVVHYFVC